MVDVVYEIVVRRKLYKHQIKDKKLFEYLKLLAKEAAWLEWDEENKGFFSIGKKIEIEPLLKLGYFLNEKYPPKGDAEIHMTETIRELITNGESKRNEKELKKLEEKGFCRRIGNRWINQGFYVRFWYDLFEGYTGRIEDKIIVFNPTENDVLAELVIDKKFNSKKFKKAILTDDLDKIYAMGDIASKMRKSKEFREMLLKKEFPSVIRIKPFEVKRLYVFVLPAGVWYEGEGLERAYHIDFSGKGFRERTASMPIWEIFVS